MELAAFVVQAVLVEGRGVREVARTHGVSKTWLYELLARYRAEGEAGLVARSKRPHRSPTRVPETVEDQIVAIRKQLTEFGVDAGPDTIHTHLTHTHGGTAPCSVSSVWRILTRRGFITPEPHKRPRSSYVRFEAELDRAWTVDDRPGIAQEAAVPEPQRRRHAATPRAAAAAPYRRSGRPHQALEQGRFAAAVRPDQGNRAWPPCFG